MSTNDEEDVLLLPGEAAYALGISYLTLWRWIKKGKIRYVKTKGGRYRIPYSEVVRILTVYQGKVRYRKKWVYPEEGLKRKSAR